MSFGARSRAGRRPCREQGHSNKRRRSQHVERVPLGGGGSPGAPPSAKWNGDVSLPQGGRALKKNHVFYGVNHEPQALGFWGSGDAAFSGQPLDGD